MLQVELSQVPCRDFPPHAAHSREAVSGGRSRQLFRPGSAQRKSSGRLPSREGRSRRRWAQAITRPHGEYHVPFTLAVLQLIADALPADSDGPRASRIDARARMGAPSSRKDRIGRCSQPLRRRSQALRRLRTRLKGGLDGSAEHSDTH